MTLWKQKTFVISPFIEIISKVEYNVDYELTKLVKTSFNDCTWVNYTWMVNWWIGGLGPEHWDLVLDEVW